MHFCTVAAVLRCFRHLADAWAALARVGAVIDHPHITRLEVERRVEQFRSEDVCAGHGGEFYCHDDSGDRDGGQVWAEPAGGVLRAGVGSGGSVGFNSDWHVRMKRQINEHLRRRKSMMVYALVGI